MGTSSFSLRAFCSPMAAAILSLSLLLLLASGCSRRESRVDLGNRTQHLHMAISAEPRDLDPHILVSYNDMTVCLALFEGLTAVDEATSQPVPAVAERWATSADGLTWTFHLRPNLMWSDGVPLTASDFVYSFQRALSASLGSEYAYILFTIVGAEDYNRGQGTPASALGIRALDPNTLELKLTQPTPTLPALLALPVAYPVPQHVVDKHGGRDDRANRWTRPGNIVSNGPFRVISWIPNQQVATEKNPSFREVGQTALSAITFYPYESAAAQEAAFRAGQIHLTSEVPLSKIKAYRTGDQSALLRSDPFLETGFFRINVERKPLNDPRVRRALALGLDRRALVENVLLGGQTPARTLTPPNTAGYTAQTPLSDDFVEARRLLAEAGFEGGKGIPPLEAISFSSELNQRLLEAVQQMWKRELGISITLTLKEQRVWLDDEREKNYALSCARWIGDYVDPSTFLEMFLSNSGNNATGWSNAEYDRLIRTAGAEPNSARRNALYQEAERLLLTEAPLAPLYHGTRTFLIHRAVKGWEPALLGFHRYQRVSLHP
ncbi:MAG TPA: peptide ABC transporter substrate-binding protein [Opitutaceae bacterium]|nr:peptide ABC transporter substrate-binding protein [Opitutaceae bacterium]